MLDTAFYIVAGLSITLFFLSLPTYNSNLLNMLIPALGSGFCFISCLGALQIEVPYTYTVNDTVLTYTVLHASIPLAMVFMLLGIVCAVKVFYNLYVLVTQLKIKKELEMEGLI